VRAESKISDEALMARAQVDDAFAFAELYCRHAEAAFLVAAAICRDPGDAEEVVQDGFFSIWRSRSEYRPQLGSFIAWSMKIVHNRAVDSFRVDRNQPRLPDCGAVKKSPAEIGPSGHGRRALLLRRSEQFSDCDQSWYLHRDGEGQDAAGAGKAPRRAPPDRTKELP
jgi:RNA polymerase sigma factor (sigma-70 family)